MSRRCGELNADYPFTTSIHSSKVDIRSLTGLRGIAALWVVMFHMTIVSDGIPGINQRILMHGYLAVDIFFILSGFIMTMSYKSLFIEGFTWTSYGSFLWRALARIYPLYFFVTVLVAFTVIIHHRYEGNSFLPILVSNFLMIQNWGFSETIVLPAWSLSVEFAAYLAFPFLLLMLWAFRPTLVAIVAFLCVLALYGVSTMMPLDPAIIKRGMLDVYWGYSVDPLLRCFPNFILGIIAYKISMNHKILNFVSFSTVVTIASLILVLLSCLPKTDIAIVALSPILIVGLSNSSGFVAKLLGSMLVFWLGEVSYALYLTHLQFLKIRPIVNTYLAPRLPAPFPDVIGCVLVLAVALAFAWCAFRFVERPMRRLMQMLAGSNARRRVALSEASGRQILTIDRNLDDQKQAAID